MEQNTESTQPQPQQPVAATQTPRRYVRPRADISETSQGYTVQVEMPGVNRQGLAITYENGEITLVGHRAPFHPPAGTELAHRESRPSDYRRTFEVDHSIDSARIAARLDQGLLTLTLPKTDAAQPRRIEIGGLN